MAKTSAPIKRFVYLDGLRGALAIAVMLGHVIGDATKWQADRPMIGVDLAVDYFFILSGFVLSYLLSKQPMGIAKLLWLRFWRLWPLHSLCFCLLVLIFLNYQAQGIPYAGRVPINSDTALHNLTFASAVFSEKEMLNPPAWSISVEFWLSVFAIPILIKLRRLWLFGIALVVYSLFSFVAHQLRGGFPLEIPWICAPPLLRGLAGMAVGVGLLASLNDAKAIVEKSSIFIRSLVVTICTFGITAALIYDPGSKFDPLFVSLICPVILVGALNPKGVWLYWLLRSPLFAWLGAISFPIYLCHWVVMMFGHPTAYVGRFGLWPTAAIFGGGTLILAHVLEISFDAPIRRWAKTFLDKGNTSGNTATTKGTVDYSSATPVA